MNTNWLVQFKNITTVYSKSHRKPVSMLCEQNAELLITQSGGMYSYQWVLKN
jgi:hypothetical protein